jgi:hypothetical protein
VSLITVPFDVAASRPTPDVGRFLRAANRRIARFHSLFRVPAFVSSDFGLAYAALCQLEASELACGDRFCEWGSGLGVVTCLAALAGFNAWGFETQVRLVRRARQLAADFDLPAEFTCGSFIPAGARRELLAGREFAWLSRGGRCGHEALGIGLDEFDVIYAYPWPDEAGLVEQLFEGHARPGALLMTYHGEWGLRLRRKGGSGAAGG